MFWTSAAGDHVEVGRNAKIRRAIIDKTVKIPAGFSAGYNSEEDARRFTVSESGIVVIPKGLRIHAGGPLESNGTWAVTGGR